MDPKMERDALAYHMGHRPGKVEIRATKSTVTQRDLSLAYSPGVAAPCTEIAENPADAYRYTARGNLVAVITNGTAVLGLGNIGPLAGKPVMEGKGVLFKKFADIDVFDIEVEEFDPEVFCETVKRLEPTFGGINLEDIKAPECFYIERRLKKEMNIPVFHDDQHGTAIICTAALINALEIMEKRAEDMRVVIAGAGAAGIACGEMMLLAGVQRENVLMLDSRGVITTRRDQGMNEYKARFAQDTEAETLEDAMKDANVFIGLSKADTVTPEMLLSMAPNPIVLAMANPDPEIRVDLARKTRDDVIMGTGRSDFPNQVNNVLGFPFIFRGALDVRASNINEEMKMAAAKALAELAKEEVPESVRRAYGNQEIAFGRDYIIPKPFDPRVLTRVAPAVAKAACDTGVARRPIADWDAYVEQLEARIHRGKESVRILRQRARRDPGRIVFPEPEDPKVLQACEQLLNTNIAKPVLVGDREVIQQVAEEHGFDLEGAVIQDPVHDAERLDFYARDLWQLRQRKGVTRRRADLEVRKQINYGCMMVRHGDADGMVCGINRSYPNTIRSVLKIIGSAEEGSRAAGMYMLSVEQRTLFFADASVNTRPSAKVLAEIAVLTGHAVRKYFHVEPRVAFIAYSNFGSVKGEDNRRMAAAAELAREMEPGMVFEGEMQADTALVPEIAEKAFPMSAIKGDANVLIFPDLQAGNIAYKLVQHLAGAEVLGPILLGLDRPANVLNHYSSVEEIVNAAAVTVLQARHRRHP